MKLWLQHFTKALGAYGPWGIFVLFFVDSAGLPIPALIDFLLIGMAAGSAHNPAHAWFTGLMAFLGSVAGNAALFWATRRGSRLFRRTQPSASERHWARVWFDRSAAAALFIPAATPIVPLPLKAVVVLAALFGTPFSKFLLVVAAGRAIRFFGEIYLGLILGKEAQSFLSHHIWGIAIASLLICLAGYGLARWKARSTQAAI
jgi:membrane protein DedA with SNARE-associated domain